MEATPAAIVGIIGAIIGAIAGAIKNRADHKRRLRTEDRADITGEREWTERLLDRLDQRTQRLEADIDELRAENNQIRREMRDWRARYYMALDHIEALTRWIVRNIPDGGPKPPMPPEHIIDDL